MNLRSSKVLIAALAVFYVQGLTAQSPGLVELNWLLKQGSAKQTNLPIQQRVELNYVHQGYAFITVDTSFAEPTWVNLRAYNTTEELYSMALSSSRDVISCVGVDVPYVTPDSMTIVVQYYDLTAEALKLMVHRNHRKRAVLQGMGRTQYVLAYDRSEQRWKVRSVDASGS